MSQGNYRFLEFTISGSYYNSKKEVVDFEGVKGKIPMCNEEKGVGSMHVRTRFAAKWVKAELNKDGEPKYPERIEKFKQVFIDDVQETTGELAFAGKDIKTLTVDEMQELAVAKDLRFIPLPQSGYDLREMRIRTYAAYSEKILRQKVGWQEEDFNFAKLPPIILDGETRHEKSEKFTNEEIINIEADKMKEKVNYGERPDPKKAFTLEELKKLADDKNVQYPVDVTHDDLYEYLFGGGG